MPGGGETVQAVAEWPVTDVKKNTVREFPGDEKKGGKSKATKELGESCTSGGLGLAGGKKETLGLVSAH